MCCLLQTPKLLDFYSDPADLKLESSVETKALNLTEDVFSEDEDYTVPYQPSLLQSNTHNLRMYVTD